MSKNYKGDAYMIAEAKVFDLKEDIKKSIRERLEQTGQKTVWVFPMRQEIVRGTLIDGFRFEYGDWFPSSLVHFDNFTIEELLVLLRLTFHLIPDGAEVQQL